MLPSKLVILNIVTLKVCYTKFILLTSKLETLHNVAPKGGDIVAKKVGNTTYYRGIIFLFINWNIYCLKYILLWLLFHKKYHNIHKFVCQSFCYCSWSLCFCQITKNQNHSDNAKSPIITYWYILDSLRAACSAYSVSSLLFQ